MSASFRLFTTDQNGITYKRDTHGEDDIFELVKKIKRKDVCREKGGNSTRGCNGPPIVYGPADFALSNGILSNEFREKDRFAIIFYEDDSKSFLNERRKALQLAYIQGAYTSYAWQNTTCRLTLTDYGYGLGPVPVEKMWIDSKQLPLFQLPLFDQMDAPTYISDWEIKTYRSFNI